METKKTEIIENAAQIIMNSGLENLTIHNLANELNVDKKELYDLFSRDEDILVKIFNSFEHELNEFIQEISNRSENPAKEFNTFFKSLYNLFLKKPYYLSIIFDKRLDKRDDQIKKSILQMRDIIESYLTRLIDSGKKHNSFKTKTSTTLLVNKILIEFKQLMKDEQYLNEMVHELKILKKSND